MLRIVDLPGGLGSDVAGAVDQVGEGVTAFSAGDEVLGASIIASGARAIGTASERNLDALPSEGGERQLRDDVHPGTRLAPWVLAACHAAVAG